MSHRSAFPNYVVFLSLRIGFTFTHSEDPDRMTYYATVYESTYLMGCFSMQSVKQYSSTKCIKLKV